GTGTRNETVPRPFTASRLRLVSELLAIHQPGNRKLGVVVVEHGHTLVPADHDGVGTPTASPRSRLRSWPGSPGDEGVPWATGPARSADRTGSDRWMDAADLGLTLRLRGCRWPAAGPVVCPPPRSGRRRCP